MASNGKYVYAEGGGGGRLLAKGSAIGDWEPLTIHNLGAPGAAVSSGQRIALQAVNGKFVYANGGGGGLIYARGDAIGDWEPFRVDLWRGCHFQSVHNKILRAEGGGGRELITSPDLDDWSSFKLHFIDGWPLANGRHIALRVHYGQWVHAEGGGGARLVATNKGLVGQERLKVTILENPMADVYRVALRTLNGQYVYAEPGGVVWARGSAIGDWEPFRLTFPREFAAG